MTFRKAIVRPPGRSFHQGLTTQDLGTPDFDLVSTQFKKYMSTLEQLDIVVLTLPALEHFPDSTFVEDVAIVVDNKVVMCNPGAQERNGEQLEIMDILFEEFEEVQRIDSPGYIDGGDVLEVNDTCFVGISGRTNFEGYQQLKDILNHWDKTCYPVYFEGYLHLKSGVSYLGRNTLLLEQNLAANPVFDVYNKIIVPSDELYAANAIEVNGKILMASGYSETKRLITEAGFEVVEMEMSEFAKMDGGLSCLSLRY